MWAHLRFCLHSSIRKPDAPSRAACGASSASYRTRRASWCCFGKTDAYVGSFADRLRRLHPQTYRRLNPVAHSTGASGSGPTLWVHAAHPSPGNGHFTAFINGAAESKQGAKREWAKAAVAQWSGGRRPADQVVAAPPDK